MAVIAAVEALALLLLGVLVVGLLRSHAEILKALHDLGAGLELDKAARAADREERPGAVDVDLEPAPADLEVQPGIVKPRAVSSSPAVRGGPLRGHDIGGVDLRDAPTSIAVAGTGHDTLLAFLSSGCSTCEAFWEAFAAGGVTVPGGARLVVVTKDAAEESLSRLRALRPAAVPVVLSSTAWDDYDVPGSPYFTYVDGTSGLVVGEGSAGSWPQVANLLEQALADARERRSAPAGGEGAAAGGNGAFRESRDDEALAAAGIGPGHASLYAAPDAGPDAGPDVEPIQPAGRTR